MAAMLPFGQGVVAATSYDEDGTNATTSPQDQVLISGLRARLAVEHSRATHLSKQVQTAHQERIRVHEKLQQHRRRHEARQAALSAADRAFADLPRGPAGGMDPLSLISTDIPRFEERLGHERSHNTASASSGAEPAAVTQYRVLFQQHLDTLRSLCDASHVRSANSGSLSSISTHDSTCDWEREINSFVRLALCSVREKEMQRDLRSKAREMKRESLQQQRDLQSRESAHNLNKKLASISRETLMDDVFRLTTERNEALVTACARLDVDQMKASE